MTPTIATEPLGPELRRLLTDSQLPTDDLSDSAAQFYTSRSGDALLGVVGLERRGEVALLRSLAVTKSARGLGIGTALVRHAERAALSANISTVYLLTTTAEQFFAVLGYQRLPRSEAPAAIASTAEFSSLCPGSSAFMHKGLSRLTIVGGCRESR